MSQQLIGPLSLRASAAPFRDLPIAQAQAPARIAAAKIEATSFAAHVGVTHVAMLSALEARLIRQAPLGEARYRAIVDAYAGMVCQEITLLACR